MSKFRNMVTLRGKNRKTSVIVIYFVLRVLVVVCIVFQLLRGEYENAFLCFLYLLLLMVPAIMQDKFKIELPSLLEIIVYLFIFSGTILGGIFNFYGNFPYWDSLLHVISGFIGAGFGFALVDLLNKNNDKIKLSPFYIAFVALCFSMTVGVLWEFFEFSADRLLLTDAQKDYVITTVSSDNLNPANNDKPMVIRGIAKTVMYDKNGDQLAVVEGGYLDIGIIDTMKDLMINFAGALAFSTLGYIYIKNWDKYKFTRNFIPKKATKNDLSG